MSSYTLVGSWRDLQERALTQLEELHTVANDIEEGTEETGLDTVEKVRGGKSNCLIKKKKQPFCRISETVFVCYK